MANRRKFQVGERFGMLEVVGTAKGLGTEPGRLWAHCRCDCGNEVDIVSHALARRTSCGCAKPVRLAAMQKARILPDSAAAKKGFRSTYRISAKQRGMVFDLDQEQFDALIAEDCHYCGAAPVLRPRTANTGGPLLCNGIDRMDPSVGYELDNCVPCCRHCNYAKRDLTAVDFIEHAKRIAAYAELHPSGANRRRFHARCVVREHNHGAGGVGQIDGGAL